MGGSQQALCSRQQATGGGDSPSRRRFGPPFISQLPHGSIPYGCSILRVRGAGD